MGKDNPDLGKVMCFPLAVKIIEKSKEKSEEVAEEGETNLALFFFDIILEVQLRIKLNSWLSRDSSLVNIKET